VFFLFPVFEIPIPQPTPALPPSPFLVPSYKPSTNYPSKSALPLPKPEPQSSLQAAPQESSLVVPQELSNSCTHM